MNTNIDSIQITHRLKAQISCTEEAIAQIHKLSEGMQSEDFILKLIANKLENLGQYDKKAEREFRASVIKAVRNEAVEPVRPPLNLHSNCNNSFGAALSPDTENGVRNQKLVQSYFVSFRDNPYRKSDLENYLETYDRDKPEGEPFKSAWDVYSYYSRDLNENSKYALMVDILEAKLTQHPRLGQTIERCGGKQWLILCSYYPEKIKDFWTGEGVNSKYIVALIDAYERNKGLNSRSRSQRGVQNSTLKPLALWMDHDETACVALIYFQSQKIASAWAYHLHHELYVGDEVEISKSRKNEFNYQINIAGINNKEAREIINIYPEISRELMPPVAVRT